MLCLRRMVEVFEIIWRCVKIMDKSSKLALFDGSGNFEMQRTSALKPHFGTQNQGHVP